MSRIGRTPVSVPAGVQVERQEGPGAERRVRVKGPKGELSLALRPEVDVTLSGQTVQVEARAAGREARAFHGMTRALLANMVTGVARGYEKSLEIIGVGWNAAVQGRKVVLQIGFAHPVEIPLPAGVDAVAPNPTSLVITGIDKQAVGQVAAKIRSVRPPEPYKGKGVRYKGEYVKQKAGKSFGS
jgi:large subunit ribosomal protein L6